MGNGETRFHGEQIEKKAVEALNLQERLIQAFFMRRLHITRVAIPM